MNIHKLAVAGLLCILCFTGLTTELQTGPTGYSQPALIFFQCLATETKLSYLQTSTVTD